MNIKHFYRVVLYELHKAERSIDESAFSQLQTILRDSHHIYVTGKGRSGLVASAFANRLLHLGFSVSVLGEITSPHTSEQDSLIVISGSGKTETLIPIIKKAHKKGLKTVLITMNEKSEMSMFADLVIYIPGLSPKVLKKTEVQSIQPMGSLFEQTAFLFLDTFIIELMNELNIDENMMYSHHADLE